MFLPGKICAIYTDMKVAFIPSFNQCLLKTFVSYAALCKEKQNRAPASKNSGKGVAEGSVTAKANVTKLDGDDNRGLCQVLWA